MLIWTLIVNRKGNQMKQTKTLTMFLIRRIAVMTMTSHCLFLLLLHRDPLCLRLQDLLGPDLLGPERSTRERPKTFLWSRPFAETG